MKKEQEKTTKKAKVDVYLSIDDTFEADSLGSVISQLKSKYNIDVQASGRSVHIECFTANQDDKNPRATKLDDGDLVNVEIGPAKTLEVLSKEYLDDTDDGDGQEACPDVEKPDNGTRTCDPAGCTDCPKSTQEQEAKAVELAGRIDKILQQMRELEDRWSNHRPGDIRWTKIETRPCSGREEHGSLLSILDSLRLLHDWD